jgi:hypothetical protein
VGFSFVISHLVHTSENQEEEAASKEKYLVAEPTAR